MEDLKVRRFEEKEGGEVSKLIERNFLEINIKGYSKEDMIDRKVPCLVIVPHKEINWDNMFDGFSTRVASDKSIKIYFGDDEKVIEEALSDILDFYHLTFDSLLSDLNNAFNSQPFKMYVDANGYLAFI